MTTRKQQMLLIDASEVERIFSDTAIEQLAQRVGLPNKTDINKLSKGLRKTVTEYLDEAHQLQPGEIRRAIYNLHQYAHQALKGDDMALRHAKECLSDLTSEVREHLFQPLPETHDLEDPEQCQEALLQIVGLTVMGSSWKQGRKRPGAKRSRPTLVPIPTGPRVRRGRPSNDAEKVLCIFLGIVYLVATGTRPPRRANHRAPGPFVRLLTEVLSLAGAPHVDAVELVNSCST